MNLHRRFVWQNCAIAMGCVGIMPSTTQADWHDGRRTNLNPCNWYWIPFPISSVYRQTFADAAERWRYDTFSGDVISSAVTANLTQRTSPVADTDQYLAMKLR